MEAIPRGLVSRDMIKMIPGIKCLRTNILPSHHSGNHQFTSTASNKVTFQIPSFPNSYINTKRSFIRFVLKTSANGVLVPQANPFRRLLLKVSRGEVLEDINSELANGAQIPLPYKSWRSQQTALSGAGTEHKIDISESAMNLTNMYSFIMPQSWSQKQSVTNIKYLAKEFDPYSFYGGRKALNSSGAFTDATDYVNKYI